MSSVLVSLALLVTPTPPAHHACQTITACRNELAHARAAVRWQKKERWNTARPAMLDATRIASIIYRVDQGAMLRVARCEAGGAYHPDARRVTAENPSSGARGPWQFLPVTWRHTPFSAYDPADVYVAALATAQIVAHDGSWRQWSCAWAA